MILTERDGKVRAQAKQLKL